ncbi:hypothetical protein IHE44_0013009 [Lamprotornis superbus]|uniref:Uncharacterized protein n=1 Tax=Lamprotornis superbus TaxID=245042 RepID=A0A835U1Z0_9PASS|nr:hypothetical protein IHE44_0013009 [Lamprotornis superbus]
MGLQHPLGERLRLVRPGHQQGKGRLGWSRQGLLAAAPPLTLAFPAGLFPSVLPDLPEVLQPVPRGGHHLPARPLLGQAVPADRRLVPQSCKQTRCTCPVKMRHVDPKRPHRQDLCGRCKGKRLSCDSTFRLFKKTANGFTTALDSAQTWYQKQQQKSRLAGTQMTASIGNDGIGLHCNKQHHFLHKILATSVICLLKNNLPSVSETVSDLQSVLLLPLKTHQYPPGWSSSSWVCYQSTDTPEGTIQDLSPTNIFPPDASVSGGEHLTEPVEVEEFEEDAALQQRISLNSKFSKEAFDDILAGFHIWINSDVETTLGETLRLFTLLGGAEAIVSKRTAVQTDTAHFPGRTLFSGSQVSETLKITNLYQKEAKGNDLNLNSLRYACELHSLEPVQAAQRALLPASLHSAPSECDSCMLTEQTCSYAGNTAVFTNGVAILEKRHTYRYCRSRISAET